MKTSTNFPAYFLVAGLNLLVLIIVMDQHFDWVISFFHPDLRKYETIKICSVSIGIVLGFIFTEKFRTQYLAIGIFQNKWIYGMLFTMLGSSYLYATYFIGILTRHPSHEAVKMKSEVYEISKANISGKGLTWDQYQYIRELYKGFPQIDSSAWDIGYHYTTVCVCSDAATTLSYSVPLRVEVDSFRIFDSIDVVDIIQKVTVEQDRREVYQLKVD